jgi:hypothetical protein
MLLYRIGITLVSIALAASAAASANATQVIPQVQYTNDNIEQGGVIRACVATAAMINPPAPEIVNLQFLAIPGNGQVRFAYKVTAGDVNWDQQSSMARRIATANFSTGEFNHPNAFKQSITPEGQLLGVLIDGNLQDAFIRAFFGGHYSIEFTRTDNPDLRTYYVEQGPSRDVAQNFAACIKQVLDSLPPG